MNEINKARALLGMPFPEEKDPGETWFRVEADYGGGLVFVGEANDRTGYLILADRAWKDGAKKVALYKCQRLG